MELSEKRKAQISAFIIFRAMAAAANNTNDIFSREVGNIMLKVPKTPAEKQWLARIIKAVILLTAGNQEVLREPEKFDSVEANDTVWDKLTSEHLSWASQLEDFNYRSPITKEDYEDAKKILPFFASMNVTSEEFDTFVSERNVNTYTDLKSGQFGNKVYRGLHNISYQAARALLSRIEWDISRAVSTSTNKHRAESFAKKQVPSWKDNYRGPLGVLFEIDVNNAGLDVGELSAYREEEVILSGHLQFDSIKIQGRSTVNGRDVEITDLEDMFEEIEKGVRLQGSPKILKTVSLYPDTAIIIIEATHVPLESQEIDESSGVSGGAISGGVSTFGTKEDIDTFNNSEAKEQRLKGSSLKEKYSSAALKGGHGQAVVTPEEEFQGYRERAGYLGLKNVRK